ncbi:MAG: hypothetical protein E6J87_09210, partial [Deltaproteobacteria bacterium]
MRAARPRALAAGAFLFQSLFAVTVFARLGAPLLWEDEAETAVHGRSVLEYGYPRVHQGRNVVYGAHHPLALGRDERLDAYLGSPWGQYYFAAPAVAWSDRSGDLAERTWRVRLPFALAGWIGVLLIGSAAATCWPAAAGGRDPLVVFALGVIAWLEVRRFVRGELAPTQRTLLLVPVLWWLFNLFYPAFPAVAATAGCAFAIRALTSRDAPRARLGELAKNVAPYALAGVAV